MCLYIIITTIMLWVLSIYPVIKHRHSMVNIRFSHLLHV